MSVDHPSNEERVPADPVALVEHVIDIMHKPPRMPQGARETQCPVCGGTYGTHADGCTYE